MKTDQQEQILRCLKMKDGAQHIQGYIFNHKLVQCDLRLSMELGGVRVAWDLNMDDAPANLMNLFIMIQWFL